MCRQYPHFAGLKLAHQRQDSSRPSTPGRKSSTPSPAPLAPVTPLASPLAHRGRSDSQPFETYEVELAEPTTDDDEPHSPRGVDGEGDYLRSKLWWAGLGLMGLGETGNFLSYGFAPASVVAPLGTVALIANCFFAPLILRESFTRRNVLGMTLAIVGAVTVVWSATDSKPRQMSPDELLQAVLAPAFLIYTGLNILLLVPLTILSGTQYGARWIGIDVGTCALYGGYTVMATKALSSLLSAVFLKAFAYPIAWVAVVVLVVTSVLQIKYLNRALMRFESKVS
ncbi:hypothetical protein A1Q2_03337 [Trichosporon asahii var. asahii CBS 8904]|uniref:Uncharacterized protein n=1 Tax=Trichosporon asahii var. asahii (strain CBS 8904) TaxID=1220162 RepID=K1VZW5_TRIAC|nr:hypothetical protein A1Q2_03337 [Trichosporon asahii var. asahii CBS 8904]